ncbi:translation initiation factor IF-3, mitochondrial isoform X3 [Latimeria chalumnae]|uniref:translation initiation factor IF-3, mitochondrial isoform X3 n=1 Tax=Latimeria chalumnae TaxID=7897 RepID=UPI0003C1437D|nr:PREDICTED: translation initiation factor IF-3, mitochondrial isoform X3 [Latimeria chalumnae]|eukprot:XP_005993008.1 PREDICTED: translation initiation factor IF-3, mitochondrial isoform X3 [Latimeria chalumnae]
MSVYFLKTIKLRMMAHCLKKIVCLTLRSDLGYSGWHLAPRNLSTFLGHNTLKVPLSKFAGLSVRRRPCAVATRAFTTADKGQNEVEQKKKPDPKARKIIGSVGRKIPHRVIHVINERGEDMGNVHRADVIRIMDEQDLKLVPLRETADPPLFKLMTGKQIHEEQLKLREKQKVNSKNAPTQIKALTFSADIAKHDLDTKIKQIEQWIQKRHHVRITLRKGSSVNSIDEMEALIEKIVQHMPDKATFVSKPKSLKEGRAVMCVIRHLSEKELSEYKRLQKQNNEEQQDDTKTPSETKCPSSSKHTT